MHLEPSEPMSGVTFEMQIGDGGAAPVLYFIVIEKFLHHSYPTIRVFLEKMRKLNLQMPSPRKGRLKGWVVVG